MVLHVVIAPAAGYAVGSEIYETEETAEEGRAHGSRT
jgi:hypothetical protein